jgi:hypothetical protein
MNLDFMEAAASNTAAQRGFNFNRIGAVYASK